MAKRKYDLAVKTGSYEKDGETRNRYMNIGVVLEGDDGMFMLLDPAFNPAGVPRKEDRVLVSMFEPRKKESQADRQRDYDNSTGNPSTDFDDEIPF